MWFHNTLLAMFMDVHAFRGYLYREKSVILLYYSVTVDRQCVNLC